MTTTELLPLLKQTSDGKVILPLHVQPGAKRDAIAGMYGEQALKLATSAPPAFLCRKKYLRDRIKSQ